MAGATTTQEEGSSSVTSSPLFFSLSSSPASSSRSPPPWLRELKSEERGLYLIQLLISCATHVASNNIDHANTCFDHISHLASPIGDTMQRIASYFTEALAVRILKSWPGLYRALNSTSISSVVGSEQVSVRRLFYDLCPFVKLCFLISNHAIIEAMEGEEMIHIIDFDSSEPAQWVELLQALSLRPGGSPHLRITGIHDQKNVLDQMGFRLAAESEKLRIPFQFNPVLSKLESLDFEKLRVKTGEALAINSVLRLHTLLSSDEDSPRSKGLNSSSVGFQKVMQVNQSTLGELLEKDVVNGRSPSADSGSSSPSGKIDGFLASMWGLSPKIVVVAEQESNHNGSGLMERVVEALHYYAALFDCLESTVPRASIERMKVEKLLFGVEIKNIVACEGGERKERHEKIEKWVQRFDLAGFVRVGLSYFGVLQGRRLLQSYGCEGYKIREENGCLVICWQDRAVFSVSAWKCRSFD